MATSVWWVCHMCGKAVVRKGAKHVLETMHKHRVVCDRLACFSLKKV